MHLALAPSTSTHSMRLSALVSLLPLADLVFASPVSRDADSTNVTALGVLKPETYATIQALFNASQIPGGILALSSPKGDEVLPMGVKNITGEPVDKDVSCAWPRIGCCLADLSRRTGPSRPIPSSSPR